jgi:hypothetical protein
MFKESHMTRGRRNVLTVVIALIVLFVVFQLIPWGSIVPAFARTNPPVTAQIQWNSAETEQLVRATCYDCHSNETVWPWYSQIAPVSWLVAHDVNEGRENLNFSTHTADQISPDELVEQIERGSMPPASYPLLHPGANLSQQQKDTLIAGLQASLHGFGEGGGESGGEGDNDNG